MLLGNAKGLNFMFVTPTTKINLLNLLLYSPLCPWRRKHLCFRTIRMSIVCVAYRLFLATIYGNKNNIDYPIRHNPNIINKEKKHAD